MIKLMVKYDRKGRIVLLGKNPKGILLVFPLKKRTTKLDKSIKQMWADFVYWHAMTLGDSGHNSQQKAIKRLVKKHFNFDLNWIPIDEGWPTMGDFSSNKAFVSRKIKQHFS